MSIIQISNNVKTSLMPTFFSFLFPLVLMVGLFIALTGCSVPATSVNEFSTQSISHTPETIIHSVVDISGGSLKG